MSLLSRIANVFRADRLNHEIDEEFESHIAEAIESGRDPAEARRAFGSPLRQRQASHDARVLGWLESLRADVIFGWRQLKRNRVTSIAAVLSLAIAMGACISAFRLVDALLWRPLPVANADHLYALTRLGTGFDGQPNKYDGWAYPSFLRLRATAKGKAELIANSYTERRDLTYSSDDQMEKAYVQYASAWMFTAFRLQPTLGRLFIEADDRKPRGAPYAVLSWDYWSHRFGQDPNILGRTVRIGDDYFQIIGVGPQSFTGTETGTVTDIFLPATMNSWYARDDSTWARALVLANPSVPLEPLRQQFQASNLAFETERVKAIHDIRKELVDRFLQETVLIEPATAGYSNLQSDYRRALGALGLLVALVLLIACVNVANLMTVQAAARAHEMALRVSIGAGRWRLVRMVLVQSAMLAAGAASLGLLFAWWAAPFIVSRINPPDDPARLLLDADWRVLAFSLALVIAVMLLFGLLPALRASSVRPVSALKGGEDPKSRPRLMYGMIALQVAFCFLVVFVSGLFVATFQRLSNKPTGFNADRVLILEATSRQPQSPITWEQAADTLRTGPGVEQVALTRWPLLAGGSWNTFISIHAQPMSTTLTYLFSITPGWFQTMKLPLLDGRDFRREDTDPGVAIVNQAFVKTFFPGENPIGKSFTRRKDQAYQIVGVVADTPYRSIREATLPIAFFPLRGVDANRALQPQNYATFYVRTRDPNPLTLAPVLRQKLALSQPRLRISNITTQAEIVGNQTVRERLLATLAIFFASVALLLAGIGLYGVLNYSVLQRRREIGIRIAVGAPPRRIAQLVIGRVSVMILFGSAIGLALGMASAQYVETLFYQVKPTDPSLVALPLAAILGTALLATLPAISRALQVDPNEVLRSE